MSDLAGSVGLGGRNHAHDVRRVQALLDQRGMAPGPVDGRFGRLTLGAILRYQRRFLREPDGRIDRGGPTWRRLSRPAATPAPPPRRDPPAVARVPAGAGGVNYTDHLPLPDPEDVNIGLESPPNSLLTARLGAPRASFTTDCQPPTDRKLAATMVTEDVGPFRVTGLRPAVASLRLILDEVRRDDPVLHGKLGTAGMLCCRLVRGSRSSISNHSWGTAIDMKIDGALVPWRASYALVGLSMLVPYFNRHGWFWGGGYRRSKDAHHFECGTALVSGFTL